MKKLLVAIALASVALLMGCRTARVVEASSVTTVVKDTTVAVAIPADSAEAHFDLGTPSGVALPDTTVEVQTSLAKAIFSVTNGRVSVKLVDGKGRSDSVRVTVRNGVRETVRSHTRVEVPRRNRAPSITLILLMVLAGALFLFFFRRR